MEFFVAVAVTADSTGAAFRRTVVRKLATPSALVCTLVSWRIKVLPSQGSLSGLEKSCTVKVWPGVLMRTPLMMVTFLPFFTAGLAEVISG